MTQRLFHLAPATALDLARRSGASDWQPASLASEGFIHLSFASQLRGTLLAHFATSRELLLLEVDAARAEPDLRLEPSRGGALFPHLYAPLPFGWILRQWLMVRRDSVWSVPYLGDRAEQDIPPGEPTAARE